MLSGEATNINFIVFGLTGSGLEPKHNIEVSNLLWYIKRTSFQLYIGRNMLQFGGVNNNDNKMNKYRPK